MPSSGNKPNSEGGVDYSTHHLLLIKEVPLSFDLLREELQHHLDICAYVNQGDSFPECMARIALKLDIALDGIYEIGPLSEVLLEALRNRRFHPESPHLRAKGLIDVELLETQGELKLQERNRDVVTIAPEGSVIVESNNTRLSDTVSNLESSKDSSRDIADSVGRSGENKNKIGSLREGLLQADD